MSASPWSLICHKTLILTDTLHEGLAKLLFSDPVAAFLALLSILQGRAGVQGQDRRASGIGRELFALSHLVAGSSAARKGTRALPFT